LGEPLELDPGSLDHLFQIDDEFGVHRIVGSVEGVQRCPARGVQDPEHAHLLKARLVDTPVFPAWGTPKQPARLQERLSGRRAVVVTQLPGKGRSASARDV
jgi:hypothetical protein